MNIPISLTSIIAPSESDSKGRVPKDVIERREKPDIEAKVKPEREIEEKAVKNAFNALINKLAAQNDIEFTSEDIEGMYAQIAEAGTLDAESATQLQSIIDKLPSGRPFQPLFASIENGELVDQIPEGGIGVLNAGPDILVVDTELPATSQASIPAYMLGDEFLSEDALPDMRVMTSINEKGTDFLEKLANLGTSSDVVMTDEEVMTLHKALSALASKFIQGGQQQPQQTASEVAQTVRMQLPQDIPAPEIALSANSALSSKWFEDVTGLKRFGSPVGDIAVDTESLVSSNVSKSSVNGSIQQVVMPQNVENQALGSQGVSVSLEDGSMDGFFGMQFMSSADNDFMAVLDDISLQIVNAGNTAPNGIAAVHQMGVTAQATPAGQIVAAALEKNAAKDGSQRIAVSLNPPELGRVIADIEMDAKNKIKVNITVEKEAAFHMLQRDSALLEQALHKAGLDFDTADLQFSFNEGGAFDEAFENPRHLAAKEGNSSANDSEIDNIAELDIPQGEYIDSDTGMARYHAVV